VYVHIVSSTTIVSERNHVIKPIVYGSVLRAEVVDNDFHPYTVEINIKMVSDFRL
jgi:hypothetical protein